MRTYDLRKALLQKFNPQACTAPLFQRIEAHEALLATDPEIRRRDAEARAAFRKEMLPYAVVAVVLNLALWAAGGYYLQALLPPWATAAGAAASSAVAWKLFQ